MKICKYNLSTYYTHHYLLHLSVIILSYPIAVFLPISMYFKNDNFQKASFFHLVLFKIYCYLGIPSMLQTQFKFVD